MSWLSCKAEIVGGKRTVKCLYCTVCTKFKEKIDSRRNFSARWITGAESLKTSNIRDHAQCDQHVHAMNQLKKEHATSLGQSASSYAPIAIALNRISEEEKVKLRHKFDVAYFVARENMSFRKYPAICELEARHGVDIGKAYTTETAGRSFVHFIAESQKQELVSDTLQKVKFFSVLLDGSTDSGNIDNELILMV